MRVSKESRSVISVRQSTQLHARNWKTGAYFPAPEALFHVRNVFCLPASRSEGEKRQGQTKK